MDIFSQIRNTKIFIEKIQSNSILLDFWNITQSFMPHIPLTLLTMDEFAEATGKNKTKSYYAFCTIVPSTPELIAQFGIEYISYILITDDTTDADIAHELAHFYIHSYLGYPWAWSKLRFGEKLSDQPGIQEMQYTAERIYAMAVHPIIDKLLKEHNLFDLQMYDRMCMGYIEELKNYLKDPTNPKVGKRYILIRTVELMLRLPSNKWTMIKNNYINHNDFKRIINKAKKLPQYPDIPKPDLIFQYVTDMWNYFNIDPAQIELELTFDTPIKK